MIPQFWKRNYIWKWRWVGAQHSHYNPSCWKTNGNIAEHTTDHCTYRNVSKERDEDASLK